MALSTGEKALIAIAAVGGLVLVAKAASSAAPQNISNKPIQATSYVTGNPVPNILAEQPGAGLGEVAGQPSFNMYPGQTVTFDWTLINPNDFPVQIQFSFPTFTSTNGPVLSYNGLNLTIDANSTKTFPITITLPSNAPIGKTWEGILSAAAGSSGVSEGVAKILTVTSISPTSTTIIS